MIHELKILPEYFDAVRSREKTFELRKNDRGFKVGDYLHLKEWDGEKYTGREVTRYVNYILYDWTGGLQDRWCIMNLKISHLRMKRGTGMRLIDADEVLARIENPYQRAEIARWLRDAPTIEERKKGKWIPFDYPWYRCSECGAVRENKSFLENYCPNCGADMRGREDD